MLSRLKLPRRTRNTPLPSPEPQDEVEIIEEGEGARMGFFDHLDELRQRLFKGMLAFVIATVVGVFLASPVLEYLVRPYGQRLQTLDPTESVLAYFRVALLIGGVLSIPVVTYQILMFVMPGLTRREQRIVLGSIAPVTVLFLIGVAFAWFILVPPAFEFLQNFQTNVFKPEWQAGQYLAFVTALLFWMGVAFETPLVFFVVSLLGMVTPRPLIRNWRIAVVVSAVAAAVITPTVDPVNMTLVMAPLLALYALSIILVAIGMRFNRSEPETPL
jgi:sec-independent protein translocase protein TatC